MLKMHHNGFVSFTVKRVHKGILVHRVRGRTGGKRSWEGGRGGIMVGRHVSVNKSGLGRGVRLWSFVSGGDCVWEEDEVDPRPPACRSDAGNQQTPVCPHGDQDAKLTARPGAPKAIGSKSHTQPLASDNRGCPGRSLRSTLCSHVSTQADRTEGRS